MQAFFGENHNFLGMRGVSRCTDGLFRNGRLFWKGPEQKAAGENHALRPLIHGEI